MESVQLFIQGISAAAPSGTGEGRQTGGESVAVDFTALLASLLAPVQPLPAPLAAVTPQPEGADQVVASNTDAAPEATVIIVPAALHADSRQRQGKDTPDTDVLTAVSYGMAIPVPAHREATSTPSTAVKAEGSPITAISTTRVENPVPAEHRAMAKGPVVVEEQGQQVLPESGVLLKLIPVTQGQAAEPRFRLVATDVSDLSDKSDKSDVKVVSVPLSAIDNGRITLPVELPSGERVTLVLRDMPDTASAPKGQGPAVVALPARAAARAEFAVGKRTPEAPREAAPVARQEQQAPATDGIIRIVLQVKPSETGQKAPETAQAQPAGSQLPAASGEAGKAVHPARPTVNSSRLPETFSQPVTSVDQPVTVKAPATANVPATAYVVEAPEIRVLNQSSRPVEVVVQQGSPTEVESAQAASQPSGRTVGEKAFRVEFGAVEAKLPGKPEKTAILADAVTGKEAVAAIATPAGSVERPADQPVSAPREVSADSIIDQVVQKFSPANRPIPSEVTVKLQPEHLGNLQMKVSVEGDQVALKIQVESPVAKQMLENNLGQLRDSFGSLGLRMDSVSVSLGMNTGWDRGQNALWQDGRGNNAQALRQPEPEHNRQEQPASLARAYPVRVDRLLDMTI